MMIEINKEETNFSMATFPLFSIIVIPWGSCFAGGGGIATEKAMSCVEDKQ